MRRLIGFFLLLLIFVTAQAADPVPGDVAITIPSLISVATDPSSRLSPTARATAIDALGDLAATSPTTGKLCSAALKSILDAITNDLPYRDYLFLHLVQAIGKCGSSGRDRLADLARLKGLDRTLDAAIDASVSTITSAQEPPKADPTSKDPVQQFVDAFTALKKDPNTYILGLEKILKEKANDPTLRILAAQGLTLDALCPASTKVPEIKKALKDVADQEENSVGVAAKQLLDTIEKAIPAPKAPPVKDKATPMKDN
jgi:hypothetical protein